MINQANTTSAHQTSALTEINPSVVGAYDGTHTETKLSVYGTHNEACEDIKHATHIQAKPLALARARATLCSVSCTAKTTPSGSPAYVWSSIAFKVAGSAVRSRARRCSALSTTRSSARPFMRADSSRRADVNSPSSPGSARASLAWDWGRLGWVGVGFLFYFISGANCPIWVDMCKSCIFVPSGHAMDYPCLVVCDRRTFIYCTWYLSRATKNRYGHRVCWVLRWEEIMP